MMSTTSADAPTVAPRFWDDWFRAIVESKLSALTRGKVALSDGLRETHFGQWADLKATVAVHRSRFFRKAVLGGTLAIADSYVRGDWDCEDLTSLFRIAIRNNAAAGRLDPGRFSLVHWARRLSHWWRSNTLLGSRRNIAEHYDLGNDFFQLWLDESMAYSSGIFPTANASLHAASLEKFDRICRKLELTPADEVLDIGAGWGGFAIHAASRFGCRVTATTISRQQFDFAREKIEAAGLSDRITLRNQDYRRLRGQFDKLVSVEMIEAVGHRYLDLFFEQCSQLLRPAGSLVLQAIVMPEQRYDQYRASVDFIQRYIFPGGCLPSLGAMLRSVGRKTDLRLVHVEDFAPHYAETLRRWRQSFHTRISDIRALGYSEEFLRGWHYYLCYCEAAFEERYIGVMQIQFDKPQCRRDPMVLSRHAAASHYERHFDHPRSLPAWPPMERSHGGCR